MSDVINAHDLGVAGGYIIEAAMQRVIDQLKAENAELRERIHELEMEGSDHFYRTAYAEDANRALEAENAKLREQIHWLKQGDILHVLTDQEYIDQCERERLMQVSIDALDKENAKLRVERDEWHRVAASKQDIIDHMRNANSENAKLRELCEEQLDNLMPEICAKAWWCEDKDWHTCNDDACGNYTFVILARELGIEVTE